MPILLVGVFERDVTAEYAETHPLLYVTGPADFFFNDGVFWYWVGTAIVEALVIMEVTVFGWQYLPGSPPGDTTKYDLVKEKDDHLHGGDAFYSYDHPGGGDTLYVQGATIFTAVVCVTSLKLAIRMQVGDGDSPAAAPFTYPLLSLPHIHNSSGHRSIFL